MVDITSPDISPDSNTSDVTSEDTKQNLDQHTEEQTGLVGVENEITEPSREGRLSDPIPLTEEQTPPVGVNKEIPLETIPHKRSVVSETSSLDPEKELEKKISRANASPSCENLSLLFKTYEAMKKAA